MKKLNLLVVLFVFAGYISMAQPACYKDIEYTLVSLKQIPKARKMMEESCFPGNESNADVWLLRGNVFIRLHEYEQERYKKDPEKYDIKFPDAIIVANESFYKALELKPDIKPNTGLMGPQDGQILSADPIDKLAKAAFDKKDYNEAIRLYNMVVRSYKVNVKEFGLWLSYAYFDLAECYKAMGDDANYKKTLLDAEKLNQPDPYLYLTIYDIYKQEKDTVKCGEILVKARRVVPDSLSLDIKGYELDYYAMIGDTLKLKSAAVKMFEQYKNNTDVIAIVVTHLINNKEYLLAEEMIKTGLEININDFNMNQLMGYRYNCEALDYVDLTETKKTERKWLEAEKLHAQSLEIFEKAFEWAAKAYIINPNDSDNNTMYYRICIRTQKIPPEGLKEKVDSYIKQ